MGATAEIVATDVPMRVQQALQIRAQGRSWRAVAHEMGLSDHRVLYAECRSWDAAMRGDERWKALAAGAIEVAQEAQAQTMEALLNREIGVTQVPIVYGIATDKVVNMRRAEQASLQPVAGGAGDLIAALHAAGGGRVTLEVSAASQPVTLEIAAAK